MIAIDTTFTDDDIAIGPVLGPEYCASNRLADDMLAKFDAEKIVFFGLRELEKAKKQIIRR